MKSSLLKDNSNVAKVCVSDKLAESEYAEGRHLQLTAVYAMNYLNFQQLTSTAQTESQVDEQFKVVITHYILYSA